MVECLQGIQIAKEATDPDENRLGNLAKNDKHFTRANNANTRYSYILKCPIEAVLLAITH
jgi:hypothetical protein